MDGPVLAQKMFALEQAPGKRNGLIKPKKIVKKKLPRFVFPRLLVGAPTEKIKGFVARLPNSKIRIILGNQRFELAMEPNGRELVAAMAERLLRMERGNWN